jgi:hypothetical protein
MPFSVVVGASGLSLMVGVVVICARIHVVTALVRASATTSKNDRLGSRNGFRNCEPRHHLTRSVRRRVLLPGTNLVTS